MEENLIKLSIFVFFITLCVLVYYFVAQKNQAKIQKRKTGKSSRYRSYHTNIVQYVAIAFPVIYLQLGRKNSSSIILSSGLISLSLLVLIGINYLANKKVK
jgi:hypothetical protein